jgi:DNA-binding HxlR family transcriptional regulator
MGEGRELQCDEALTRVFSVLGKRWSGLILGTLLQRPARFGELARAIDGITDSMLSARLVELQGAGLVEREVLEEPPIATLYRLTAAGRELEPALLALASWAERHLRPGPRRRGDDLRARTRHKRIAVASGRLR